MQLMSPGSYRDATELEVMSGLLDFSGARVLELGCGRARWTRTIAEKFPAASIVATEVDRVQHEKNLQITDLPQVSFRYGGAESIDLPDSSVDIVIMLKSLHHVPRAGMAQGLKEIHRVLRTGGRAYISEPVYAGEFNEILRLFNDEQVVRQAAFDALRDVLASGLFELLSEEFFQSESIFLDFAEFEERILFATHSDHRVDEALRNEVRAAFLPFLGPAGAKFINPHRVDLLGKI